MSKIFEILKESKEYEYESGKDELEYLYLSDNLSVNEQIDLAECLADQIINMFKKGGYSFKVNLKERNLIYCMNPLIRKINTLINEGVIEKRWIEDLTDNLIYNGERPWEVKLGLILASKYLPKEKLSEVFEVFSKSGEYIFYLTNAIRNLYRYNEYLVKLSKDSRGTIKVFSITNIDYFSLDVVSYLIEQGYKDEMYEEVLIKHIFTTINLSKYLENKITKGKMDNLSYLICSYLRKNEFSLIRSKSEFIERYLSLISKMEYNYEYLNSIYLIKEAISEDEKFEVSYKDLEKKLDKLLEDEKWSGIFESAIQEGIGIGKDILSLANFYEYKLEYEDLYQYLKRDTENINIYYYLVNEGNEEDKIKLFKFFKNHFNLEEFYTEAKDIDDEQLQKDDLKCVIFALIVKSLSGIYPQGKNIAIKAINGRINKIRYESVKYLKKYRDKLTNKDLTIIRKACETEPNYKIKHEIETLIFNYNDEKKEYIDVTDLVNYEHVADIFLVSTEVTGCQFRHIRSLEEELENSKIFNLKLEENNSCDDRVIKVIGENGFVIGFISRKDNYILSNLLSGGKYLYGKIDKYNLDNNHIDISVYLSYKDVIESINDTILMLHGSNTGGFLN
ncbi:HIRAN domain-containing protein [Clostridium sp. SHJSY1]|uniref:HIRAN domain-containing protein n=1 Tax=Clostridium sp. SHJSY1 TaxID=2942483 RepID=UPI002874730D|nr:HIRAN domain-containing protein [Clostridium sp. SHJSY1]MDS0524760.1 HIRAN domain-containing protein [Clostridium sp. SHJSY1]